MSVEKCPACNGSGESLADNEFDSMAIPQMTTCRGCNGKGWVETGNVEPAHYDWVEYGYSMDKAGTIKGPKIIKLDNG